MSKPNSQEKNVSKPMTIGQYLERFPLQAAKELTGIAVPDGSEKVIEDLVRSLYPRKVETYEGWVSVIKNLITRPLK